VYISCKLESEYNFWICDSENPPEYVEHVTDSPKLNVICSTRMKKVHSSPFFIPPRITERTVTGIVCLLMLQNVLIPQFDDDYQERSICFQQDCAPPHFHGEARRYFNTHFPDRWVTQGGPMS
jgi:hypothetical protein